MVFIIISVMELVLIIILMYCLKEYYKERDSLKATIVQLHQDMGFRISAHIESMLTKAQKLKHKIPAELYTKSLRKNAIVKETCDRFYDELTRQFK